MAEVPQTPRYFSCEHCLRMFLDDGSQPGFASLVPSGQRVFVVPEIFQCGLPECAEIVEQNRRLDEARDQQRRQRLSNWRHQRDAGPHKKGKTCRPPAVAQGNRPYADKDLPAQSVQGPDHQVAPGCQIGNPAVENLSESEKQELLRKDQEKALDKFLRTENLGRWFTNFELQRVAPSGALHSVISRLRQRYRREGGEFILPKSRAVTASVWKYAVFRNSDYRETDQKK